MLNATIEFWPFGDKSRAEVVATAVIGNDGSGTKTQGNYTIDFFERGIYDEKEKRVRVEGFLRQEHGPFRLLYEALKEVYEDGES